MNNDLRILISASLNVGKSVGEINNAIKSLENHVSLRKINLKIDLDSELVRNINQLTNNIRTLAGQFDNTAKSNEKINTSINGQTQNINKQIQAIKNAAKAQEEFRKEQQKTFKDAEGNVKKLINTYGNNLNNTKVSETIIPNKDGSLINKGSIVAENYKKDIDQWNKMLDEAYKMNDQYNKKLESLDRAHYAALKENKARQEAMEKMHYLALQKNREIDLKNQQRITKEKEALDKAHFIALQQNRRREEDFLRRQQDTINKIETARTKFGHHAGVNDVLDNALFNAQSIKSIGDYQNRLKDINTSITTTTRGLKAARNESLKFGEAFSTAINYIVAYKGNFVINQSVNL